MKFIKKKPLKIVLLALAVLLAVAFVAVLPRAIFVIRLSHAKRVGRYVDFETYRNDFVTITQIAKAQFEAPDAEDPYLSIEYKDGKPYLSYQGEAVDLTDAEYTSFLNILGLWGHVGERTIQYDEGRISYYLEGGYSLVYTFDDEKPTYLIRSDEDKRIIVKKIEPHWYHVTSW